MFTIGWVFSCSTNYMHYIGVGQNKDRTRSKVVQRPLRTPQANQEETDSLTVGYYRHRTPSWS